MANPHPLLEYTVFFGLAAVLIYVVGEYLAWVYRDEANSSHSLPRHFAWFERLDGVFSRIESAIHRITGIDPDREMNWKQYGLAVLVFNAIIWVWLYAVLFFQHGLPMNYVGVDGQSWDLAYHTASSFTTNTNQQHYSGETLSVFTHTFAIGIAMFLTPATGLALMPAFARAFNNEENGLLGNFYANVVRGAVRFLLPFALLIAVILMSQGSVQTILSGQLSANTLTMGVQDIRIGPHAGIEAIKMWGTNGGGINGANAATAFENPTPFSNLVLTLAMPVSTFCAIYAWGVWVGKRTHGVVLVAAFFLIFMALTGAGIAGETGANPAMDVEANGLSVDQEVGNMESKETRFGPTGSAIWGLSTTSTTNGGVNSMHNSWTAMGTLSLLFAFAMNNVSNGVGTGLLNILMFVMLTAFIGALMIGRRPQYLGKKLEWQEIRYVFLAVLWLPLVVLIPQAHASISSLGTEAIANPGFRGFSEMLYEFMSATANNGSGLEGLGDNTPYWNVVNGTQTMLGRYVPILAQLAIAGSLAQKKISPEGEGALDTESPAFLFLLIGVITIIGALTFLPALVFGPIGELFSGADIFLEG
ncbi:potassium-transporting ATPase subunit KdpA [Halobacteria archaeon AArc-m2/3/4]|uniref:Potassium-transporting ATPase potassium-binding subunit n=1 Tax=Natronoglomus mannanivorans TaxID=2979990 RepID=A0AAP3E2P3_9EURY|nr:potassium-transporting ATPase subunit KdpA [Halobacteria archaeon AArc-xg1-1]MCU4975902.1 potassium-transporting ATPase subunit KdpA [Halobacteria archaeon AArc-m2/3/4]